MNPLTKRYLKETLCFILDCKCEGGCILKSMKVDNRQEITVEPFDHRFDVDRVERTLKRRKKAILKALGSDYVTVTVYDDMRMYGAYTLSKESVRRVS